MERMGKREGERAREKKERRAPTDLPPCRASAPRLDHNSFALKNSAPPTRSISSAKLGFSQAYQARVELGFGRRSREMVASERTSVVKQYADQYGCANPSMSCTCCWPAASKLESAHADRAEGGRAARCPPSQSLNSFQTRSTPFCSPAEMTDAQAIHTLG